MLAIAITIELYGAAAINGDYNPLNKARGPSFLIVLSRHAYEFVRVGSVYILTLIVSKGCPTIMPAVFATVEARIVLNTEFA